MKGGGEQRRKSSTIGIKKSERKIEKKIRKKNITDNIRNIDRKYLYILYTHIF